MGNYAQFAIVIFLASISPMEISLEETHNEILCIIFLPFEPMTQRKYFHGFPGHFENWPKNNNSVKISNIASDHFSVLITLACFLPEESLSAIRCRNSVSLESTQKETIFYPNPFPGMKLTQ